RVPGALAREGAHVHLVDHLARQANAAPAAVGPREGARVDDLRRAVRPLGLEARGRVREEVPAVEPEAVAVAGAGDADLAGEVTAGLGLQSQGDRAAAGEFAPAVFQDHFHAPPLRCPDPEMYAPLREGLRPDGEPSWVIHESARRLSDPGSAGCGASCAGAPPPLSGKQYAKAPKRPRDGTA